MNIDELIKVSHSDAKAKGWWDEPRNTGELLMLIVSECGEALEAHRGGRMGRIEDCIHSMAIVSGSLALDEDTWERDFVEFIKDGFSDELADIVIRIADLAGGMGWSDLPTQPLAVYHDGYNIGSQLLGVVRLVSMSPDVAAEEYGTDLNIYNLADAVSCVYAIARHEGIDLDRHIELKLAYNRTRPYRHAKLY